MDGSNQYGDDFIGWPPGGVTFYRANNAAPCDAEGDQRMQIDQTGGRWVTYKTNRIKGGIDVTTVWSYRDGQAQSKAY